MSNAAIRHRRFRAYTAFGIAASLVAASFVSASAPALAAVATAGQPNPTTAQSNEVLAAKVGREHAGGTERSGTVVAQESTLDAGNVATFGAGAGTYTVPANVTGLLVEAAAGGGGISVISDAPRGGYGALVRTPIPVTPGETLEFFAGSAGGTGAGGGGGGATNFQLDDPDRTIIAGGGGGGSGLSIGGDASMGATGAGGDGRNIGASGSPGIGGAGGTGGDGSGSGTDSSYGGGAGGASAPFGPVAAGPGGAGQPGIDGVGGTGTGSDSAGSGGGGGWGGGGASGDGESTGGAGGSTGPIGGSGFGATSYGWAPLGSSGEGLDGSVTFTALSPATDVAATPGDASAIFSWTEPAQPVEGVTYTVWAQPLAGSNAATSVRTSGETLAGLTNGVPYTITVVASTSTGLATVSDPTTVTPTQDALGLLDVEPATGPSTGGQWVHLGGSGFTPNTTVAIGAAATDAVYVSPTSMWAKTAAQQTGAVDVTVVEGASTSTRESAYIVAQEGFSISNVSPTGYTDPGDPVTVTISGSGFVADSQVYFGDQVSPVVSVTSAASISAFPPAGIGTVDIKVVAPGGAQAIAPSAYAYTTNRYVCDSTDTNTACADSYRVPSGVEALQVTALGSGGTNSPGGLCNESGGDGALVTSSFNVAAGQVLAYQLGRTSSNSTGDGGGGGGSTSVEPNTPQQVIAGGGGGAGSCNDGGDAGANSDGSGSAGSGDWGGGGGSGGSGGQAQQQSGSSNEPFDGRPGFGGPGGDGCDSGSVGGAGIGDGGGGACSGKGGGGGGGYGGGAGGGMNSENPFEGGSGGGGGGSTGPAGTTFAAGGNAGMTGLLTINWLGQPADVRAQAGDTTATVTWEPALGAPDGTTYEVFVDGAASGQTTSPATISGLANGITSEIYVQATAGELVTASESVRITPAPLPSITSLSPQAGGTTGGTQVTIEGDNLPSGSSVLFDSVPAEVSGGGGSELVAVTPAHGVGTVDVTVITPNGSRAESTYEYVQGPQITAIEPTQGPVAGGTTITITGSHLDDASSVEFGGVAAQIDSVAEGEITVTTLANLGGLAEVVVTAQGVESEPVDFGYVANISGISPNSGPAVESGAATISGEGLTEAATVTVGGAPATVTAATATTLDITLPSGRAGEQAVQVAIDGVAATGDVVFTYQPVVTSVSPSTGHTIGGATVTVAGAGFTPDSTVSFGGVEGTSPDVSEDGTSISVVVPAHAAATVPVVVTSEGEVSSQVIDFTYVDVPVLSSIAPISGTAKGGTPITIQGEALADTAVVTLGGEPATDVVVNDAGTSITATTEAHLAGIVPVVVTIGDNSSTQNVSFTYEPVIDSLSPAAGPVSQATTVTVRGAGFAPGSSVQVGSTAAIVTSVSQDGQTIEATFPAQAAGIKDVTVNSNSVESSESASFTYVAAPSVSAISPSTGPVTGGADVTITGENFTADTVVLVGDEPLTDVEVRSSTEIAGTTPAGSAGLQAIAVQTPGGSVVLDDAYTYAPVVTSVNPGAGVQSGGTEITIVGAGFVPSNQVLVCSGACNAVPTAVTIGGIDATDVEVTLDGTTITATTPAGTGTQPIVVTSNEIPASESFSFTYIDPGEPLTPTFGNVTALAGGFDVPVTNYTPLYGWSVTASAGSVVINDAGLVSVSGLLPAQASTVTVTTQREFVASASSSVTGSALRRVPAAPVKGCVVTRSSLPRDGVATVMKAHCKTSAGTPVKIRLKVGLAPRGDYQVASLIRRKSGLVRVRTYGNPGTVTLVYTARGSSQVLPYRKVVSYRV